VATLEEEEEEAGHSRDHTSKKVVHTYHPSVISCPWPFGRVVHIPLTVARIVARPQTPKTGCPQVLSHSVGEFAHLISIGSTRRSCLHPQISYFSLNWLLYVSWKLKKNHQIQFKKIITYKRKWLNEHTTKCSARLSTTVAPPFRGLHSACASRQKAPLGMDYVQEM